MNRSLLLLALGALSTAAPAATLAFPDLTLTAGPPDTVFTTTATSALGTLEGNAILSFTLTTEGETWISDLTLAVADPSGTTATASLPNAPDAPGDYTGAVSFASATPGSGVYSIMFANTFGTAFDVTLSNIRLEVTPTPVPEPVSFAALACGATAMMRRRKRA